MKKSMLLVVLAAMLVGAVPALAQVETDPGQVTVAIVDCVLGGPCIGTSGNDTTTGSDQEDVILGLEGDDVIDPGADLVTDYVFCGPGEDVVDQMPRVVPDEQPNRPPGGIQYASEDFIAEDCETRAL